MILWCATGPAAARVRPAGICPEAVRAGSGAAGHQQGVEAHLRNGIPTGDVCAPYGPCARHPGCKRCAAGEGIPQWDTAADEASLLHAAGGRCLPLSRWAFGLQEEPWEGDGASDEGRAQGVSAIIVGRHTRLSKFKSLLDYSCGSQLQ